MKIPHGKITNISARYDGKDRIGDYGSDKKGFTFVYTVTGWKVINEAVYEIYYWRRKYEKLKAKIKNSKP